jgi:predicted small secreted protein
MKKFTILLTIALLFAAILTACAPETIVETVIVEK